MVRGLDIEFEHFFDRDHSPTFSASILLRLRFPLAGDSLLRLLGKQNALDVGEDSSLCDGHTGKQLVQLLVVPVRETYVF